MKKPNYVYVTKKWKKENLLEEQRKKRKPDSVPVANKWKEENLIKEWEKEEKKRREGLLCLSMK